MDPRAHEAFMRRALDLARAAGRAGEVPVGAVLVRGEEVVGEGSNQPIREHDPTAHAEVVALRRAAAALGNYRLPGTTLYVTVEPCLMCVGALVNARVATLVYGAPEPKSGAVASRLRLENLPLSHRVEVVAGVLAEDARGLLVEFFKSRRNER
ncbi:MAG TPA: tRNA adenosine(34) deaminase TadA [Vicinamibacteria bacterium]|nr:tRNA adenosine(34) deaminase TadA [Vicinamibacteria bacterium]